MNTDIAKRFDIEVPIFAFSHCRDVVAAVTNAGGMGVLGAAWMTAEELEMSIEWVTWRVPRPSRRKSSGFSTNISMLLERLNAVTAYE